MKKKTRLPRRAASLWLTCVLACTSTGEDTTSNEDAAHASDAGQPGPDAGSSLAFGAPPAGSVLVHLFEWRYEDIARECELHLGPTGIAAVQISPPSEHLVLRAAGFPWWQRYQPVSYTLESRSGSRAELADMVDRCARVGVAIYVDAVLNHMSARTGGVGSNGTRFSKYAYPNLYTAQDFHRPPCAIADEDYASDKARVQTCELLDLSDLDTGAEHVRETLAAYLVELIELGVRGFRIDAAKHMSVDDLRGVFQKVRDAVGEERLPFVYSEVFTYGGEAVTSEEYLTLDETLGEARAAVLEFRYTALGEAFLGRGELDPARLEAFFSSSALLPSARAVVFVDNHDTQRNGGMSYHDGALHDLAVMTMLAAPYGIPALMSSYAFDRATGRDRGPPSDANGVTDSPLANDGCSTERVPEPGRWVCEHRRAYVAGLVALRRAAAQSSAPLTHFWSDGGKAFAFARDGIGFLAINAGTATLRRAFATGLPPGSYCDVAHAAKSQDSCEAAFVDAAGDATLELAPGQAIVLFGRAK